MRLDKIRRGSLRLWVGIERFVLNKIWECMLEGMESGFQCAACGEWNVTSVDQSAGRRQSYVEDCQVCCKPNVLRVEYDASSQEFFITAELE